MLSSCSSVKPAVLHFCFRNTFASETTVRGFGHSASAVQLVLTDVYVSCIRERRKQKFVEMEQAIDALAAQTKNMNSLQHQNHLLQVGSLLHFTYTYCTARCMHCWSYVSALRLGVLAIQKLVLYQSSLVDPASHQCYDWCANY